MRQYLKLFAWMIPSMLLLPLLGCIVEDKIVDFVINEETCGEFVERHVSANYTNSTIIDYAKEIDEALEDNDLSRSQIQTARIVSGNYTVTAFSHEHDWVIGGAILVSRDDALDGPDTLMEYSGISLRNELGVENAMPLHPDGVALLHRAIDDYLAGLRPRLVFTVQSASVTPEPSPSDSLKFDWEACLLSHVVVVDTLEVLDP